MPLCVVFLDSPLSTDRASLKIKDFEVSFLLVLCFQIIKLPFKIKCNSTIVVEIEVCCTGCVKKWAPAQQMFRLVI